MKIYLLLLSGWILYFAVHSILASNAVKRWIQLHLPVIFKYYRILYNVIAITGLVILLRITIHNDTLLFQTNTISKFIALILSGSGFIILAVSFYTFDKKEFLGFKKPEEKQNGPLVTSGIYQYVRHPLYTGTILLVTSLFILMPTFSTALFVGITLLYIEIGSRLEEKKLTEEFGAAYTDYCKKVKRYFPFLY